MTKLLISAATLITLLVVTHAAFAAGASRYAPGHKTHHMHGASSNSPGHMYLSAGKRSVRGHPGASGYAPGHHVH